MVENYSQPVINFAFFALVTELKTKGYLTLYEKELIFIHIRNVLVRLSYTKLIKN